METNFGSLFRNRKQINFQKFQTHYFSKILENSGFEKHNPKGLEIQNLWKKSIEIKDVQTHNEWFHNFAQLFLQNYQDWKPKENEISNKFDFEQFSQAIQNDEAHPTRLIFETLRNLVFYLLHLKKSQANITNEIYQTKNNDKIEILSLEMLVILSNSRFNRAILFKYGLFDILVELGLVVYAKAFNLAKKLSLKQNLESNSRDVDNTNIDVNVDDDFDIYIYICSSINRILCFFLMNDYQFEKHVPQNIEHGNNDKINVIDREEDEEINLYDISITGKPYLSWISELFITDLLFLFTDLFNEFEQKIKRTEILSQTHISLLNLLLFTFSHGLISKELTTQASNLVISQLRPPSIVYENLNENQNQIKNQNSKYLGFEKRMIILQLLREIIVNIPDSEIAVCKNPKLYYLSDLILWVAYTFPQDWVYETINENEISLDNLNEESFNLSNPKKDYSPPSSLPKPPPLSSIQRSKTNPKINLRDFSKYLSNPFLHRLFINLSEICLHKSQKSTTDHEKKPHESRSNTISDQENQNKLQSPRIARSTSKTIKQSQNKIKYKIIEACLNIWDTRPSKKSELDPKIRLFFTFISPELQFFILELLLKVGAFDIRNILTKKTVWNILFSQAFWHSPQFENVHLSKSHSECFQSKKIFFQKFVYNTASRKDKPNLSECTCLIEMFEKYQDDLQIKHEVLDLLMKILISNPRRTKKSLVSLNFISKISAEIRRFHLIQRKYMKKDIKTSFPFDPKVFHKIRYELFDSFCVLFSIDDIRKQALGDDTTPIMLRDLLLENQTKRLFKSFHIVFY
ncbi:hypothetical protein M0811_13724 [Anaeramoeba ignava]|uniref:Uncharacterized protein n=1 Tax=Anaeramoeba ignava TaxID=1746090 RepID=A0A9Q0L6K7_ANAIG|nr:hypothetical protein M0811_13724 [Anaeramoeba ignava]